jgi:predicted membrane protein
MEKENLRGYKTFMVLKNVSNPVMFLGLPMKLALFFLSIIMISCFMAMIMKAIEVSLLVNIAFPSIFAFIGITGVRAFYKKYGIKGFSMSQRNKNTPDKIRADKTVQQILKEK